MNGTGDWGAEPENDPENAEANRSMQAHATVDQSLDSTRRMMSNLYETEETGNKTMEMLNDQGEQLHRIEQGMDTVNRDMREAEKHLTALERCCGCCTCPSQKVDSFEDNEGYASTWNRDENTVVTNAPGRTGNNASGTRSDNQQMIQKITGDEREDEMEQNLQLVSGMLSGLKNMAIDMGDTIESQNTQIDRINDKTEQNEMRVDKANTRAKKMLDSGKKKKS